MSLYVFLYVSFYICSWMSPYMCAGHIPRGADADGSERGGGEQRQRGGAAHDRQKFFQRIFSLFSKNLFLPKNLFLHRKK